MPVYNAARYLSAALQSVLDQGVASVEILVVDDGSKDTSVDIARAFAARDARVRCLVNQRSKGVSGARNTGLDHARGEWVAFLDADDLLTPGSFSTRLDFLARHPECRILATDHAYIDEGGTVTVARRFASVGLVDKARQRAGTTAQDFCLRDPVGFFLDEFCLMWTGAILLHRSVVERVGRFDETMTHGEDTRYWFQAALHDPVYFQDIVCAEYRQSATSASADVGKALKGREDFYRGLAADGQFVTYRDKANNRLVTVVCDRSYSLRIQRRFALAAAHALRALRIQSTSARAWRHLIAAALRKA